jgi:pyrroline-5-carboxylate reductase
MRSGWAPADALVVVETDPARRAELAARLTGVRVVDSPEPAGWVGGVAPAGDAAGGIGVGGVEAGSDRDGASAAGDPGGPRSDDGVLAVKPADAEAACRSLREAGVQRVLSIAAGVTLQSLQSWLGASTAVVRAMPNTPALIGSGAAAIAGGQAAGPEDLAWAQSVLQAVGTVVVVPEAALDAVTGLSGSGPAYVLLLAEALIDAGVLVGLARPVAKQLAVQTLLGSARLLSETGDEPAALRAAVTSPGGTTAAGLRALEAAGFRHAVLEAVAAAARRSEELGRPD